MDYELIKLTQLSGQKASIYTLRQCGEAYTLFEEFLMENLSGNEEELKNIITRLKTIGIKTGARIQFFKQNEGIPGDGVCALFDVPGKNLRLYCIRYGNSVVVVGGGGLKPKSIKTLQQDKKLTDTNLLIRKISQELTQKMKEKEIKLIFEDNEFEGDLKISINN